MENAFRTLGAVPEDDKEKLKRLCEGKEALSGDASPFRAAYAELVDPGKRVIHEIAYFESGVFGSYFDILDRRDGVADPEKLAGATVSVGRWFEGIRVYSGSLVERIDTSRESSGFPVLDDAAFSGGADGLRRRCFEALTSCLDGRDEASVACLFNAIVDVPDFRCPFVDELMAYYELRMRDTLYGREARIKKALDALYARCDVMLARQAMEQEGFSLSPDADRIADALKEWYRAARPLQINMKKRGGQSGRVGNFILGIESDMVLTENAAKDQSAGMVEYVAGSGAFGGMESSRREADKVIAAECEITGALEALMQRMIEMFSELDAVADRLKTDLNVMRSYSGRSNRAPQRSGGCYIATCVYGSYDCPEVWILRRYRDYHMSSNPFGRAFVKIYYRISPTLVRRFGDRKWFRGLFRSVLDRTVRRLRKKGYADTPYVDLM